jgi:hypothetical protein
MSRDGIVTAVNRHRSDPRQRILVMPAVDCKQMPSKLANRADVARRRIASAFAAIEDDQRGKRRGNLQR